MKCKICNNEVSIVTPNGVCQQCLDLVTDRVNAPPNAATFNLLVVVLFILVILGLLFLANAYFKFL